MDDLTQVLQNILSSEDGQETLKNITESLSNDKGEIDLSLLEGILGNEKKQEETQNEDAASESGFDIGSIMAMAKLFEGFKKSDPNSDLILALKPLLRPERQKKADSAVKILKLISLLPLLRESGVLENFL